MRAFGVGIFLTGKHEIMKGLGFVKADILID
jgi:hypothetical protein